MSTQTDMQRNKLMHLEDNLVMYGIYNTETLEKLVKTVHALHSRQTLYESLFAARHQHPMNFTDKCMAHIVYSIMQLIQCCT